MKFTERAKIFLGDLFDGIACRISTAGKYVRKHLIPFSVAAAALITTIVLLCVFVPKITAASDNIGNKQAEALPSGETIVIPTLVPTATPTATPTPSPTPDPTPTPVPLHLERGVRNDIIIDVQQRLMELNYMDYDEPTNYFGPITEQAVKLFQRRNDLETTGVMDQALYSKLMSSRAKSYMAQKGDSGVDIKEMAKRLYELDYLKKVTDTFDDNMEAAVKHFQEKNGLTVDGMVGSQTMEALYSEDAVPNSLYIGSTGDEVKKFQNKLWNLGYLPTKPDGIYGEDTVQAVKRFQSRNDLIVDGYLGPNTKELLNSSSAKYNKLEFTMSGDDVHRVQQRLQKLNYLKPSEVTGYFGQITEQAVRAFQKNNKLEVDGKVAKETLEKLFSSDAKKAERPVSSTPVPTATPKPTKRPSGSSTAKPTKTPKPTGHGSSSTPKPSTPKPTSGSGSGGSSVQDKINLLIKIARTKLGRPYVRGAKGPDAFDCSGFVYWCLNKAGVQQSYMTSYMWRSTSRYPRIGSMSSIKAGDVIVFKMGAYSGHVAIAVGNGMMIDASSREGKVVYRTYNSAYWRSVFYCAYRIFGN